MMLKMEERFIEGAVANGVERGLIEGFWKKLIGFADYCFNKSHSACYGLISYQTAYLKAHYPAAFMAALMTSDYDDTDRLAIEISECQHMGVAVLPPDVNESFTEFAVVPKESKIRFGMAAIKNVGTGAVEAILQVRQDGPFLSIEDFFQRVNPRLVNRKVVESLIKSGAFDRFGERSHLLHNIDLLLAYANREQKQRNSGQTDLFGNAIEIEITKPMLQLAQPDTVFPVREQLMWERELLGIYLSQHPLESFEVILSEQTVPISEIKPEHDKKLVTVGGAILDVREITTRNGQKMAFIKLADQLGEIECILFPSMYQQTLGVWERDRVVLIKGKVNAQDKDGNPTDEVKILIEDAREITSEQAAAYQATGKTKKVPKGRPAQKAAVASSDGDAPPDADKSGRLYLRLEKSKDETLLALKAIIDANEGDTEVVLVLGPADSKQIIRLPMRANSQPQVIEELALVIGADNVRIH